MVNAETVKAKDKLRKLRKAIPRLNREAIVDFYARKALYKIARIQKEFPPEPVIEQLELDEDIRVIASRRRRKKKAPSVDLAETEDSDNDGDDDLEDD